MDGLKEQSFVAEHYAHSTYAEFTRSLQDEQEYLQMVQPGMKNLFAKVERSLDELLIPALFWVNRELISSCSEFPDYPVRIWVLVYQAHLYASLDPYGYPLI